MGISWMWGGVNGPGDDARARAFRSGRQSVPVEGAAVGDEDESAAEAPPPPGLAPFDDEDAAGAAEGVDDDPDDAVPTDEERESVL